VESGWYGDRWQELPSITRYCPVATDDLKPKGQALLVKSIRRLLCPPGENLKLSQGRVVPSETEESIRLPDLKGASESGILESGRVHSTGSPAHRHLITSHELLASPIVGSVPSGNR
jgi:hypothetical protein